MIDLIRILESLIGRKAKIKKRPAHPADMMANFADVDKAGRLLGWEPQISLNEGIARLVSWYNAERDWASQIDTE
jgi:UDP-glucuronate 4-epimerase